MDTSLNYKEHYTAFSQNVAFAARTWHHHVHLNNKENENPKILVVLDKAQRYWLDQRYSAIQTTVIFLGKIFDTDKKSFNIHKMLQAAQRSINYFHKSELKRRKIEISGEFDGIDDYIERCSELDNSDIKIIRTQIKAAEKIWERIKPLRDKIYAHNEILSDSERAAVYQMVKYSDVTNIIQILLNVSNALLEAEINGRKPDFSHNYTSPIEKAKKDIDCLIASLMPQEN